MSLLKEKLSNAFRSSSSDNSKSRVTSNQSLLQNNAQLSLLYQLEQRKVRKLEDQNRALLERIQSLITEEDEARIHALVADRTKRKLVHLRSIAKRAITSLEAGIKEFDAFVNDVDEGIQEQIKSGAMDKPVNIVNTFQHVNKKKVFAPNLKRIAESPVLSEVVETIFAASVDQLNTIPDKLNNQQQNVAMRPTTSSVAMPTKDKGDELDGRVELVEEKKIEVENEEKKIEFDDKEEEAKVLPSTVTKRVKRRVNYYESYDDASSSTSAMNQEEENKKEEEETIAVVEEENDKKDGQISVTLLSDSQLSEDISFGDALHGIVKFNPPIATDEAKKTRESIGGVDRSPSFIHVTDMPSPLFTSTPKPRPPKRSSTGQLFTVVARNSSAATDSNATLPPLPCEKKKTIIRDAAATVTDHISIRPPRSASKQQAPAEAEDEEVLTAASSQQRMPPPPLPKRRRRDDNACDSNDDRNPSIFSANGDGDGRMTRSMSQQRTQKSEYMEDETVDADGSSTLTSVKLGGIDGKEGDEKKMRINKLADEATKRAVIRETEYSTTNATAATSMMSSGSVNNVTAGSGRARRAAVEKVASYQLPTLKIKLRRE